MQSLPVTLMIVDEDPRRLAATVLRPGCARDAPGGGGAACVALQGARRPDPRRNRQPTRAGGRDVRLRPDGGLRPFAADDLAPPEGAARCGARRVVAPRDVGVLPRRARCARRAGRRAHAGMSTIPASISTTPARCAPPIRSFSTTAASTTVTTG